MTATAATPAAISSDLTQCIRADTLRVVSKRNDPTYEEAIAAYLSMALEEGQYDYFLEALSNIARAHGIAAVAASSGLGRESLYKALASGAKPRFETVCKVMSGVGLRLIAIPKRGTDG